MAAIDALAKRLAAARLAHRRQHHSFREMAGHRRRPSSDDGQRLRRLVGKLHRRICRDDPVRGWTPSGRPRTVILRTGRATFRPSSGSCEAIKCRRRCSSARTRRTVLNMTNDLNFARACADAHWRRAAERRSSGCNVASFPATRLGERARRHPGFHHQRIRASVATPRTCSFSFTMPSGAAMAGRGRPGHHVGEAVADVGERGES
mgnify:CR=1 FL=1